MCPSDYGICGKLLEGAAAETDWNDSSLWIVLLDFLETERRLDPLVRERLARYLDDRVAEELGETVVEDDDDVDADE